MDEAAWVEIRLNSILEITSWQLGLSIDPDVLLVDGIEAATWLPGYNLEEYFGLTEIKDGKIRTLWVAPDVLPMPFDGEGYVFRLHVKALRAIEDLTQVIKVDNDVLLSVGYSDDDNPIAIVSGNATVSGGNTLATRPLASVAAAPNPFVDALIFDVEMPETVEAVHLILQDALGRIIYEWKGKMEAGKNQIHIDGAQLSSRGVLKYVLLTPNRNFSGSVVKL